MRSVKVAVRGEINFFVHLFIVVLAAKMFNTAIERMARAVTRKERPEVWDVLVHGFGANRPTMTVKPFLHLAAGAATIMPAAPSIFSDPAAR